MQHGHKYICSFFYFFLSLFIFQDYIVVSHLLGCYIIYYNNIIKCRSFAQSHTLDSTNLNHDSKPTFKVQWLFHWCGVICFIDFSLEGESFYSRDVRLKRPGLVNEEGCWKGRIFPPVACSDHTQLSKCNFTKPFTQNLILDMKMAIYRWPRD